MEKVYSEKQDCCGCTACVSICPTRAIQMVPDSCGFLYPRIKLEKCIDCGLCQKTCQFSKANSSPQFRSCYVVKHKAVEVVKESRSGGIFTALSDYVLLADGVIYGALLDENLFVHHARATSSDVRDSFRKSKYVQSDLTGVFLQVQEDLKNGYTVMFTGCPCQCDGLKGYLAQSHVNTDRLLLCDLICHSNGSPELFKNYLQYLKEKYHSDITEYYFRDKDSHHWMEHVEKVVFTNGKQLFTNEYTNLFFGNDIRPSCFKCKYTSLCRSGDITLGDCWGGQTIYPDLVNETGASLVLLNTSKGQRFFEQVSSEIICHEIPIEVVFQPRLKEPEIMSETYHDFWRDYSLMNFADFLSKYSRNDYSVSNIIRKNFERMLTLPYRAIKKIVRLLIR